MEINETENHPPSTRLPLHISNASPLLDPHSISPTLFLLHSNLTPYLQLSLPPLPSTFTPYHQLSPLHSTPASYLQLSLPSSRPSRHISNSLPPCTRPPLHISNSLPPPLDRHSTSPTLSPLHSTLTPHLQLTLSLLHSSLTPYLHLSPSSTRPSLHISTSLPPPLDLHSTSPTLSSPPLYPQSISPTLPPPPLHSTFTRHLQLSPSSTRPSLHISNSLQIESGHFL